MFACQTTCIYARNPGIKCVLVSYFLYRGLTAHPPQLASSGRTCRQLLVNLAKHTTCTAFQASPRLAPHTSKGPEAEILYNLHVASHVASGQPQALRTSTKWTMTASVAGLPLCT